MIVSCSAVILAIVAIVFTNLPPGPYPWVFLIAFFFLILIAGLLHKKMEIDKLNRENATKMEQLDRENATKMEQLDRENATKMEQLVRENAIKNNRQIVIRALGDQFESQKNACLEIKSKSSNTSHKEIQQIIQAIDQGLVELYNQYQKCVDFVQTSIESAVFEYVKNTFYSHAIIFQERLSGYAHEINQLNVLFSQQNLKRMFNEQCEPLMNKIEKLMEICCISIWTEKLNALKSEFDTFMAQTVTEVAKATVETEQLTIKYRFEASLKDFGIKIQECGRRIDQQGNMLKNICNHFKEVETKYALVLANSQNITSANFLDFENLSAQMNPVKRQAEDGFKSK